MKKILIYLCSLVLLIATGCRKNEQQLERQLAVSSYYPNSGNAGTLVTILGTGFPKDGKVMFGDLSAEVLNQNDTSLVVRAPESGQTGRLSLVTTGKTIDIGNYTYQELSVHSFTPSNGPAGMHMRISGAGFGSTSSPAEVTINGMKATVVSVSDTLIVAEVPEQAGSGPVTVSVNGKSSAGANFLYQAISSIKPLTGGAGTKVVINGAGFDGVVAGNTVDFNGKTAQVLEAEDTKLVVVAPEGVTTGPVSVTINGQKTAGPAFTIVPFPSITTVTPLSGPKGLEMTISGVNFSKEADENVVTLNGTVVPVKTASGNKLTLTIPGGTGTGKVVVNVNDQKVEGPDFADQNLGITQVLPATGLAGTKVTISGVGFSTVAGENAVTFNGVSAAIVSATATELVVTAPASLSTGELVVHRAALVAKAPAEFLRAGVMTMYGGPGTNSFINYGSSRLVADSRGNVYVADRNQGVIRKIAADGTYGLYGGSVGTFGRKDGPVADALFSSIFGMAIDGDDNIFVGEVGTGNNIRKITAAGVVSTYKTGLTNFIHVFLDTAGGVYISQTYNGASKVYANGSVEKKVSRTVADVCRPVIDAAGNIYFLGDDYNSYLSMVDASGIYTMTWLGSANAGWADGTSPQFMYGIHGMVQDADGNLIIWDGGNYALRKYDFKSKEVTTLMKLSNGFADGSFEEAKVSSSVGDIAIDKEGSIYLLDNNNGAVRKIFLR